MGNTSYTSWRSRQSISKNDAYETVKKHTGYKMENKMVDAGLKKIQINVKQKSLVNQEAPDFIIGTLINLLDQSKMVMLWA